MRYQGRLSNWNDDKGFGFVTPNGGGQQAFVHIKSFSKRQKRPVGNEIVTYEIAFDPMGRAQAENVEFFRARRPERSGRSKLPLLFGAFFLMLLGARVVAGKMPLLILGFYLAASVAAFVAYALDKSAATHDRWRTPEATLHLLAVAGGWPGALLAQYRLRHKSKKTSFLQMFWVTVVLNCGLLYWLARLLAA